MSFHDNIPNSRKRNKPLHNEVAAIFARDDGAPRKKEFVIKSRYDKLELLRYTSTLVELLFPKGEPGLFTKLLHLGENVTGIRGRVTLREYYSYKLTNRNEQNFKAIFFSSLLFQQYIVDAYVKIEVNRLFYLRNNQSAFRVEHYIGLSKYLDSRSE